MKLPTRLRRSWDSVRPRTRHGAVLATAGILAGAAALSAALFVGAAMAWNPYVDYSIHRDVDARAWAALDPTFAGAGVCATCHAPESRQARTAAHAGIGCQGCHGPLSEHALASTAAGSNAVAVAVPRDDVCVRCHVAIDGRPAAIRQITPASHYVSTCLACHDPHTGVANRPPVVQHPLENLPPCLTCHGPEGFKARNVRHPVVVDDRACLECHAPGRGPEEPQVSE